MADSAARRGEAFRARCARIGVASVHEAASRRGALPHILTPLDAAMRLAGPALPVRAPRGDNLWIHRALAEAGAGDILVVEAGHGEAYGYWGEVMARAALARGVAGLVITGGVRDKVQLIALGLPTFSSSVSILGTVKDPNGDGDVGEPVRIGDIIVRRGDFVMGDADGLFACPMADAAAYLDEAEAREAKEQDIFRRLAAGETTMEIYNLPLGT
jgi:4-hydroxy-4-methyl-2-oxoglutarate aldolase